MNQFKVFIAVQPMLIRETLERIVASQSGCEVVGTSGSTEAIDLMLAVRQSEATMLLTTLPAISSGVRPEFTHLLAEFPDLLIVQIDLENDTVNCIRQTIQVDRHSNSDVSTVLTKENPLRANTEEGILMDFR